MLLLLSVFQLSAKEQDWGRVVRTPWTDSLTEKYNFSENSENAEYSGERELRGQLDSPERNISGVIKKYCS